MKQRFPSLDEFINESEKIIDNAQIQGDKIIFGFNCEMLNDNGKLIVHVSPSNGASEYFNNTGIHVKKWDKDIMEDIVDTLNGMSYGADGVTGAISRPVDKNGMKKFASILSKSLNESEEFLLIEREFIKPDMIKVTGQSSYGYDPSIAYKYGVADKDGEYYKKGEDMFTQGDSRLNNMETGNQKEAADFVVKTVKSSFTTFTHAYPGKDAMDCTRKIVSCILAATKKTSSNSKKHYDYKTAVSNLIEKWKNK
jgi:hypothetical protein